MNTPLEQVFLKLGIALGLGLLVGLQRERAQSPLAGIRTFALLTLLGTVSGLLGAWAVAAGAIGVALLLVAGNLMRAESEEHPGLTTEVAVLLMYAVGAYLAVGHEAVAVAVGGATALLLQFKEPMHAFVARMGEKDITAIMQFVLIALVILPVLPDQAYDAFGVLNPRKIWLMVVLIVAINLGGYITYKLLGEQVGTLLGAILGGLISSTATTVSYARRTKETPEMVGLATVVMLIATTVAYLRVMIWIGVVAPTHWWSMGLPLLVMLGLMGLLAAGAFLFYRGEERSMPEQQNPAELKTALIFGGLYAGVLFAIAAAKQYLGDTGLYGVAILSGLHDMDAITLSTSQLVQQGHLQADTGWRLVLIASLANLVMKGIIAAVLGLRLLAWRIAAFYGLGLAVGILLVLLWPASPSDANDQVGGRQGARQGEAVAEPGQQVIQGLEADVFQGEAEAMSPVEEGQGDDHEEIKPAQRVGHGGPQLRFADQSAGHADAGDQDGDGEKEGGRHAAAGKQTPEERLIGTGHDHLTPLPGAPRRSPTSPPTIRNACL